MAQPTEPSEPVSGYTVADVLEDMLDELRSLTKGGMDGMRPATIARYERATTVLRALRVSNVRRPGWTLPT